MTSAAAPAADAAPVEATERIGALDVLRGMALFGVFLINILGYASAPMMATSAQLDALPTAAIDGLVMSAAAIFVSDKANTLFAVLFGIGFHLQMTRLSQRVADAAAIYVRRLTVLLLFGLTHLVFIFAWDILHLYALCGLLLLVFRRVSSRVVLVVGVVLAVLGRPAVGWIATAIGWSDAAAQSYSDAAILARQAASESGDYGALVRSFLALEWREHIASGALFGLIAYVLGRFLIGMWIARQGWLESLARHRRTCVRIALVAIPVGVMGEVAARLAPKFIDAADLGAVVMELAHWISVPILAAGYACAALAALQTERGARVFSVFAPMGRMALTSYVLQSLLIGELLFGIGPGLALAGHVGVAGIALLATVLFALQMALSAWWFRRFAYGPLEWAWRALTYGAPPRWRTST